MKRIIALLLVVLLGAGLSGCGLIMDAFFGEDEPEFGLGNFGEQTVATTEDEVRVDLELIGNNGVGFMNAYIRSDGAAAAAYMDPESEFYGDVAYLSPENDVALMAEEAGLPGLEDILLEYYKEKIEECGVTAAETTVEDGVATVICEFTMVDSNVEGDVNGVVTFVSKEYIGYVDLAPKGGEWLVFDYGYMLLEEYYELYPEEREDAGVSTGGYSFPYIDRSVYSSDFTRFYIELSDGWEFYTRDELYSMMGITEAYFASGIPDGPFTETFATRTVDGYTETFIVNVEATGDVLSEYTLTEHANLAYESLEKEYAALYSEYTMDATWVDFGLEPLPCISVTYFDGERTLYEVMLIARRGDHTVTVDIIKTSGDFDPEFAMMHMIED